MKTAKYIAVVIGTGMMLGPCMAIAQAAADQSAAAPASAPAVTVIPADQQPTKEQLAKLFELMQVKEHLLSTVKMAEQQIFAQARQRQNDDGLGALATGKMMEQFIQPDEMLADMIAIYQKHLTRLDVDGMIAFYSSPAGQHWIAAQPAITKEYLPIVMKRVQERMQERFKKTPIDPAKPLQNSGQHPNFIFGVAGSTPTPVEKPAPTPPPAQK